MRAIEFIKETAFDNQIKDIMLSKGYKFLGAGQDQDAYLEPGTGMVLKIFGTGSESGDQFTKAQQSFIDFANFCMANPNNQFLPYFDGWERFEFDGHYYLQIRVERMFDISQNTELGGSLLYNFSNHAGHGYSHNFQDWYQHQLGSYDDGDQANQFVMLVGSEKKCDLLWNTIVKLSKIANQKGYTLDLHEGNFMLGEDGEIIISDPFFAGELRKTTSSLYNRSSTNSNSAASFNSWGNSQ